MRLALLLSFCVLALACNGRPRENPYTPGGTFAKRLDASGRRHIIRHADGTLIAKFRMRRDGLRVFDASMMPLGEVDLTALTVTRKNGDTRSFETADGATVLQGSLRIEPIEQGWVVFDAKAARVGYFAWTEDGRLALRDDYGSTPRAYGASTSDTVTAANGKPVLTATPSFGADLLVPFALKTDALDPLERAALGAWLRANRPTEP